MTTIKSTSASNSKTVSRRAVVGGGAIAAGVLALGVGANGITKAFAQKAAADAAAGAEVGAWVVIAPDDQVTIRIARSEMGQGTLTGLAQLVAEELECDWTKVKTEYPTPGENLARSRVWGDMSTGGSRGIRGSHEYVRQGGAAARGMLLQAAATLWSVPVDELTVQNSIVTHAKSGKTISYGKLVADASKLPVPDLKSVKLKDPKDWKLIGKAGVKRLDTADKLNGKQIYAIDLKLPGMLTATIMDAPVFGAKIKSYDEAKVKAMAGVKGVYKVGDTAVAVVAETFWQAKLGLDALGPVWEETPNNKVSSESIAELLKAGLTSTEGVFVGNARATQTRRLRAQHRRSRQSMTVRSGTMSPWSR